MLKDSLSHPVQKFNLSRHYYEFAHHYIRTHHICSLEELDNDLAWMSESVRRAAWQGQAREFSVQSRFEWLINKAAETKQKYDTAVREYGVDSIVAFHLNKDKSLWAAVLVDFVIEHASELVNPEAK